MGTAELAGRTYVPKLYTINSRRRPVVDLLRRAVEESGGRVVSCSFPDAMVAPIFVGAEDHDGHRYGLLLYPFTTTRRSTKKRPGAEHRFQFRFGDPVRHRQQLNPLGKPRRFDRDWEGLESMVGIRPRRLLDYARFESLATSLGLDTALRVKLAEKFKAGRISRHALERLFGIDAATILDIVESNFRLGVAVRGSVAEHHLGRLLASDPTVMAFDAIDEDGKPDFLITLHDRRQLTIECKNALRETYKGGDAKVETQKTRDSGAGRKYTFDSFDIVAACMFSVTGRWTFRFKRSRDLVPWTKDPARIGAIQRIDASWSTSLADVTL